MKKRRWIALLLVVVLAFAMTAIVGCTSDDPEPVAEAEVEEVVEEVAEEVEEVVEAEEVEEVEIPEVVEGGAVGNILGPDVDLSVLEGLTVGFAQMDSVNSWRIAQTDSVQSAARELGVNLIYADAAGDVAKQASDIEDMVAQGADFIIVAPLVEDGLQGALRSAMEAGVGVILVDRGIDGEAGVHYDTAVMADFIWEGQQVAEYMIEATGGVGNVVILQGTPGSSAAMDRQIGFTETIAGTDMVIIADQVANFAMPDAIEVMENILQAHGDDIDIVFAHNDDMALGAITAIRAAGLVPGEDILVGGIDSPVAAMEAILAGEQLVSVSCSPFFGPISFEIIARMIHGETIPPALQKPGTLFDINNADVNEGF